MKKTCCLFRVLLALVGFGLAGAGAQAAVTIIGAQYQPDRMHPEFDCIWDNTGYPGACPSNFAGANVHVYLRNDGGSGINVTNMTISGYDIKTIIRERVQGGNDPYSIYYAWDDPPQGVFDAGEPVWYRYDPTNIPPGAVFQAVVRLRLLPVTAPVSFGVLTDAGTVTTNIAVDASAPQLASVGFSKDLDKVYLHWRRSNGTVPTTILMDGTNVTSLTTTVGDPSYNYGVSVITLTNALTYMSYHVFQGIYADGKTATASLRAWVNKFNIGTYGAPPTATWADAMAVIDDYQNRGVDFLVYNFGSDGLMDFVNKPEGVTYAGEHSFMFMPELPSQWNTYNPLGWYLRDEPDAHDFHLGRDDTDTAPNLYLPENNEHSVGILAMHEILSGDDLHYRQGGITPTVVNVDATYMPYNYYTYGQMADIGMSDPYYDSRQSFAYWNNTNTIPLYAKAYPYIYAVAQAMTEASEPNPSLIALNTTGDLSNPGGGLQWWPYASAENNRMQNYYAVAGGAKSLAYWWMLSGFGDGIITNAAAPTALWKGIGLCGNEFRTAQPLLVISHPAAIPVTTSTNLWARTLIAGMDAIVLMVLNDKYTDDINGFHYTPVSNSTVTVTLPSWFNGSATSFEIAEQAEGITNVSSSLSGNQLQINLGTVNLTRLIVVTTNAQLRASLQQRYIEQAYQGVCAFAPDHCKSQATCILNADAESGFRNRGDGVIASNWFEFEGADGTNITCFDETTIKHSGSHSQRIRTWKSGIGSGASGGVYQRIPAFSGTNYTISAWVYAADTGSKCYLGVSPTGGTDPNSGVIWSTVQTNSSWTQKTWTGNASNNFMTVFYKVVSSDGNKRNGYFDDATPACTSPTITSNPNSVTNCPGGTTNFTTAASGPGTYSYQWQRSGINLTDAGHYSGANTATLTVSGYDSTDAGDYRCAVTTSYGVIFSGAGTLAIKQATTITQQPVAHDVCSGGNTSFTVAAVGDGTVTYQWQTNGVNISNNSHYSGCTTATLWVTNAGSADAVNYRCVATANCGNATSFQGALTIATAGPTITGNPTSKDICPGSTVNFAATASGTGVLTYQWQKNGSNLSNGGHYSNVTAATMTVTGADSSDVGSYRCVVSNGCGSANSTSATLTLGATPALLNGSFEGTTNASGVATNWVAYQRAPNPTSVWSIQTAAPPVGGGTNYQQIVNTSSTGGGGVRQDVTGCTIGATYTVAGWFRGNSGISSVCRVRVSPTASTNWATAVDLSPAQSYIGSTWTNFSGTVVATATTMTLWLDGQTTSTGQNKAECFDAVTVTCVGGISRPTVTSQPVALTVCPGVTTNFSVTASGGGTLTYQWQTNSVNLSNNSHYAGATAATLWVTNVASADAVNYRCVVSNEGGSTNSSDAALALKAVTSITGHPAAQNICAGANATFSASATGDGTVTYQWQTNGVNIANGSHYAGCTTATLWVTNASSADVVNYRCVATAGCGSANSSDAALTLKTATGISGQPSVQNVCPGANATFTVSATGDGSLTYQWQTNGVNLSDSSHYAGCTTATMWVTNAATGDQVNYRCVVTGGCGNANSSDAALTLKAVTTITGNPSAQNVCPGATATFNVSATGDGALSYQWQTNGVNIANGSHYAGCTTATLWVTNSGSADTVNYRCVVTGGCGNANSSDAALTLKAVTTITDDPDAQNVCTSATATFSVAGTGEGALTYQWQTNNVNIGDNSHYAGCTSATLWVTNSGAGDQVNYRCVVTGGCGSANSSAAALTLRAVTTITGNPAAQTICAGITTNFIVSATGDGTVSYQWQTNSVNISDNSHYAGCTTTTLWVTNAASGDQVNYRCVVTAGCGSANSSTAAITLKTTTSISQQPSARSVCSGTTTNFSVTAAGDGTVTYQWQTNGVNISNNSHYSGCTTATMWVTNAGSADQVNYRCVVTAGCGSVNSSDAALTLKTATSISQQPVSRQVSSGGTTNFSVTAAGDTLTYQWQTNSVNVSNGGHFSGCTTATLTVSSAASTDAMTYRCVVTGTCGAVNSSGATLTVCISPTLLNASFEGATNVNGVATNWFGYQRSPNPTTVWTIQSASPPIAGSTNYQQIANTSSTGGGGVRQDIKNCVIGATYNIAGWMRGNSASATCTVKVSPTASTNWATAVNLSPAATYTGSTWTNFSGTVTATGTNMTLWLDGQTSSTGLNKAECFDVLTVTCSP